MPGKAGKPLHVYHAVLAGGDGVGKWRKAICRISPPCYLVWADNRPDGVVPGGHGAVGVRGLGRAFGVGVIIAEHLLTAAARLAVRGNQRGGIDFEMGFGVGVDVSCGKRGRDGVACAKEDTAAFFWVGCGGMGAQGSEE